RAPLDELARAIDALEQVLADNRLGPSHAAGERNHLVGVDADAAHTSTSVTAWRAIAVLTSSKVQGFRVWTTMPSGPATPVGDPSRVRYSPTVRKVAASRMSSGITSASWSPQTAVMRTEAGHPPP